MKISGGHHSLGGDSLSRSKRDTSRSSNTATSPIEDQCARAQLADGTGTVSEAGSLIPARAADEMNVSATLVSDDPPPIHLFLIDPTAAMERVNERRDGGLDAGQADGGHRDEYRLQVNWPELRVVRQFEVGAQSSLLGSVEPHRELPLAASTRKDRRSGHHFVGGERQLPGRAAS